VVSTRHLAARAGMAQLALAALAVLAGCSTTDATPTPAGHVLLDIPQSAALATEPGGGLLVAPLAGGTIRRISANGSVAPTALRVPLVRTDGQRGLLSLAVGRSRVYASWTPRSGERLVVGRLRAGMPPRIVWTGPRTTTLANGGHLAFAPGGRLVIGIGDRQSPRGAVGRLLSLDPAGPPTQRPRVLSTGWNNPFAFAFTPDDRLWVADNAPGAHPERLARGDAGRPHDVTDLPRATAPSGLAALSGGDLALCGVVSGTLDRYRRTSDGSWTRVGTIAADCRYGVVRLTDGRLAYAGAHTIRSVRP
jgi:glucose/arabinose dehydrogenase